MQTMTGAFEEAVKEVNGAVWGNKIPDNRKLKCYAFYKQATLGNVIGEQPWAWQVEKRAKWDSWNNVKGLSKTVAKQLYVGEWTKQKREFQHLCTSTK